jgi:hypothetical protein
MIFQLYTTLKVTNVVFWDPVVPYVVITVKPSRKPSESGG